MKRLFGLQRTAVLLLLCGMVAHSAQLLNSWQSTSINFLFPSLRICSGTTGVWMNDTSTGIVRHSLFAVGGFFGFYAEYADNITVGAWLLDIEASTWTEFGGNQLPMSASTMGSAGASFGTPAAPTPFAYIHGGTTYSQVLPVMTQMNLQTYEMINYNSPPLFHHTLTPLNGTLFAFGGFNTTNTVTPLNAAWAFELSSNTWHSVSFVGISPRARAGHTAQTFNNTLFILLGCALGIFAPTPTPLVDIYNCLTPLSDVWAFTYTTADHTAGSWVQLPSVGTSGCRASAFNPATNTLFVFGGEEGPYMTQRASPMQTFILNPFSSSNWSAVTPSALFPPPHQRFLGMALWDPLSSSAVLFGGKIAVQIFDGANLDRFAQVCTAQYEWLPQASIALRPAPRVGASLVKWPPIPNGLTWIFFGGAASAGVGEIYNDVFELIALDSGFMFWIPLSAAASPPPRQGHFAACWDNLYQMAIFGGVGQDFVSLNDVWLMHFAGEGAVSWTNITPSSGPMPSARQNSAGFSAYDRYNLPTFTIFGGVPAPLTNTFLTVLTPTTLDDMWTFSLFSNQWTQVPRSSPWPEARGGAMGQVVDNLFVMYGGFGNHSPAEPNLWVFNPTTSTWRIAPQIIDSYYFPLSNPLLDTWAKTFNGLTLPSSAVLTGGRRVAMVAGMAVMGDAVLSDSTLVTIGEFDPDGSWHWTSFSPSNPIYAFGMPMLAKDSTLIMLGTTTSSQTFSLSYTMDINALQLGCFPGSYSPKITATRCIRCPRGTYLETATAGNSTGSSCINCPVNTITRREGAVSKLECSVCDDSYCGHGRCRLNPDYSVVCDCNMGYSGDTCDVNVLSIIIGVLFGCCVLAILLVCVVRRVRRRLRGYQTDLTLAEKLLSSVSVELRALEQVMMIAAADVRLTRLVDAGSFGEVWLGEYQERTVAIKRLRATVQELDASAVADFDHEIKLLRRLRHRNIVFFYGAGLLDGGPFLVTEYMARGSLKAILHGSAAALGWRRRLRALQDTAAGMHYLHSQTPPFIHRDLKSGNLLVTDTWTVKVCDLGTARVCGLVEGGPRAASSNAALDTMTRGVGTLLWTAPEVLQGRQYDIKADVYSFSIVMFEVLTRVLPYPTLNTTWAVRDAVEAGVRPEVPADCPSAYGVLMRRCWSTAPADRPAFGECLAGIEAMLAAAPADSEEMQETEAPTSPML